MLFGEGTQDLKSTGGNKGRISTVKPGFSIRDDTRYFYLFKMVFGTS
jgi:hypothetical protein